MPESPSPEQDFIRTADELRAPRRNIERILELTGRAIAHLGNDFTEEVFLYATISLGANDPVDATRHLLIANCGLFAALLQDEKDEFPLPVSKRKPMRNRTARPRAWR
jgi:hypothetical protein